MMQLPILSFFSHDSILLGEDGRTHQPIEQLAQLRAIIGNTVFRPCDLNELVAGYQICIKNFQPVSFALSRTEIQHIEGTSFEGALCGGYLLENTFAKPNIVIVSSGSEMALAVKVAKELRKKYAVNVVSMPSIEVFEKQSVTYKNKVINKDANLVLCIEASNDTKWLKVLGSNSAFFGVEEYQGSGSGEEIYSKAGFNVKNIVRFVENKLKSKQ